MEKVTSRDLAQAQTREALLAAALQLVADKGLGAVSIGDIALAAGFTKGAFYSNFASRDAMVLELLIRLKETQRRALAGLEAVAADDLPAALDALATGVVRHACDARASNLVAEVQLQGRRDADFAIEARAAFDRHTTVLAAWIDAAASASGQKPALPSPQMARMIMGLSQGLSQQPADADEAGTIARTAFRRMFNLD